MNKPIIIDGVDVSGCNNFKNKEHTRSMCAKSKDCYYKQLQRVISENEELKRKNTILELVTEPQRQEIEKYQDKAIQYKQALEEINKIVNKECEKCVNDETNENYCIGSEFCTLAEINEVLKDE